MYNSDLVTDWQPGQPVIFKGVYQGQEMVFVKGHGGTVIANKCGDSARYTGHYPV